MKKETKEQRSRSVIKTILLSATECARICGISRRSWFRFSASAKIPASVKISGSVRWRQSDIEKWIELGCPCRKDFEEIAKNGGG